MTHTTLPAPRTSTLPPRLIVTLIVGIFAVSTAAIFIRFARQDGAPVALIAAGRLTLSALILTPLVLLRYRSALAALTRRDLLLGAAAGFFLALHFIAWIASLDYTSVLISVVFVATGPLWVALLEFLVLRVGLSRLTLGGLAIAFGGGLLIGLTGTSSSPDENTLLGAVLALLGAVTVALYLIIGRSLRARLPLLPYVWMVYGFAAVFLLLVLLATGTPVLGYAPNAYVAIILLGLVPQLIGHSAFNYALGYLSATAVSLATQLEPIASAIVAFFVFRELPTNAQIVGAVIILVGVMMAILGQRPRQAEPAPAG